MKGLGRPRSVEPLPGFTLTAECEYALVLSA